MNNFYFILCSGRHDIPVDADCIFDTVEDITAVDAFASHVGDVFTNKGVSCGDSVTVYVTGLTVLVGAVVSWCAKNGVHLTLMHYNRESEEYFPQEVL